MTISIRPATAVEDFAAIEQLQPEIWGASVGVTPTHLLLTIAKEGGVVLLALDDQEPIGFAYGFPALAENNRVKLASHQVGVLPAYQNHGIGYKLKLAQREATLAKNLDHITWTFDPLQGRNAWLNLRKLGAVCNTYIPNLYGEMADDLNLGLPTDRFRVDWWLATEHVNRRLAGNVDEPDLPSPEYPVLNEATVRNHSNFLAPSNTLDSPKTNYCLVQIPADISTLKQKAPDLALMWRLQTRDIFKAAFGVGYTAIDLLRGEGWNYYLLQKDWQRR